MGRWAADEFMATQGAQTLAAAVEARTLAGGVISCDLSGGLDSTPLCFLAARGNSQVIAVTLVSTDSRHDDARWAQRAADQLDGIEHLVLDVQRLPLMYEDVGEGGVGADEPHIAIRDYACLTCVASQLVERGSRLHPRGLGRDVDALRTVCLGLYLYTLGPIALDRTLACEAWLRTLTTAPSATATGSSR
jgi:asparagine synthetase B (glutamine-hydrolysing)